MVSEDPNIELAVEMMEKENITIEEILDNCHDEDIDADDYFDFIDSEENGGGSYAMLKDVFEVMHHRLRIKENEARMYANRLENAEKELSDVKERLRDSEWRVDAAYGRGMGG